MLSGLICTVVDLTVVAEINVFGAQLSCPLNEATNSQFKEKYWKHSDAVVVVVDKPSNSGGRFQPREYNASRSSEH